MLKLLFQLLKTLPAFQRLLSEHFDAERAELQEQVKSWQDTWLDTQRDCRRLDQAATAAREDVDRLISTNLQLQLEIAARNNEIAELKNATTQKLEDVDVLPADAVWDASVDVRGPKPAPRS